MANGKLQIVDCKLQMANCKWQIVDCELQIAICGSATVYLISSIVKFSRFLQSS